MIKSHLWVFNFANSSSLILICYQQFTAVIAEHFEKLTYHVNHADMVNWSCQLNMTEVPWTISLVTIASVANLISLAHSHARVIDSVSIG